MRKFNITVNGKTYEVDVEEVGGVSSSVQPAAPARAAAPAPAATPKPAPKKPAAPAAAAGQEVISAPMPGSVWKVEVKEGDSVEAGDVLLILEAMKMENEILAPRAGVVSSVTATEGASVNTGDQLVILD